jgi:chromosome segregation ATPase
MTETEALQNQFHDELHTTNLKIIDVSTNLAALSDRVDAISDSNEEVNNNLNRIANLIDDANTGVNRANDRIDQVVNNIDNINDDIDDINSSFDKQNDINDSLNNEMSLLSKELDDHESRISSLENQTKQTAHEVAVRAAKSVTRSINDSEIAELHQEIHDVAHAVDDLSGDLEPRVRQLESDVDDLYDNVHDLQTEDASIWEAMEDMDVEHHEELHRLALAIDNHDSSISLLWNTTHNYIESNDIDIERLDAEDASIWDAMEDMDVEHHEELHRLAMAIDRHDSSINDLSVRMGTLEDEYKPHIVLTEAEYEAIDNPDINTFYFTYEY